ncbi:hypothetical protein VMT65_13455 [Nocardia sp. CDC153]|uniref:hypothetical protein n=1 Tax=Nocardia sp. CDC153 TaxID=3112167 RepID=UPI002DB74F99|nr:hypothetical protein [Nocardia sp. CDC153]MEC3954038.1 hypothetical protein [Nocardia sp. CDC153]
MTDMLRADITALRIMAAGIRAEADAIAAIDPVDLIAKVAQSMPNSATGAAATGVCEPLRTALSRMADQLEAIADTTAHATTTYEQIEADLEHQLDSYLHPTP